MKGQQPPEGGGGCLERSLRTSTLGKVNNHFIIEYKSLELEPTPALRLLGYQTREEADALRTVKDIKHYCVEVKYFRRTHPRHLPVTKDRMNDT